MQVKNRTGYKQLRKTSIIDGLAQSSQDCASGTCDMRMVHRRRVLSYKKSKNYVRNIKVFERAA